MAKKSNGKSTPKPKHKGGRPTKLDPNVVQKLTAAFHNGFNSIGVEILPEFARKSTNLEILTH